MDTLQAYRDDGPIATVLGAVLRMRWLNPVFLALFGAIPLGLALAAEVDPGLLTGSALGWFLLLAGGSSQRSLTHRLDWLTPILLRVAEYGFIIWLAYRVDPGALPAAYAVLFAASVHQYEIVYRIRHTGGPPPRWVGWAGGGFEGRMLAAYLLALAGARALTWGLAAIALWAAVVFIVESASVWVRRPSL